MKRRSLLDVGLAVALVAGGATVATVARPSDDQTVKVCVGKRDTVVSAKPNGRCPSGSRVVRINQTGPVGATGATGSTGATGARGADGTMGANGATGGQGEQGMAGATGATAARQPTIGKLVDQAIDDFTRLDNGNRWAHSYAWMAKTVAVRRGWDDPLVATYLSKVYAQQNPDGGYGLPEPWDAFGDGTVNPANTTYAITLTDHVGPVLLEGWQHGVVPQSRVQEVIDLVEAFPLANTGGTCVAYSTTPADAGWCVGNINASAAQFLVRADEAGFDVDLSRVPGIVEHGRATLLAGDWWPYMVGETARQDWVHNSMMVDAAMTIDPPVGRRTLDAMRRASVDDPYERAALLRLAPFDCELADPALLAAGLDARGGDAYYVAILAWEGAVALEACS